MSAKASKSVAVKQPTFHGYEFLGPYVKSTTDFYISANNLTGQVLSLSLLDSRLPATFRHSSATILPAVQFPPLFHRQH